MAPNLLHPHRITDRQISEKVIIQSLPSATRHLTAELRAARRPADAGRQTTLALGSTTHFGASIPRESIVARPSAADDPAGSSPQALDAGGAPVTHVESWFTSEP